MSDNVFLAKPVYWHEGLFLRPQHLQQQDFYSRYYNYGLHALVNQNLWGVIELQCNEEALRNNVFDIEKYDVLFADGTRVNSKNNINIPRRNFSQEWKGGADCVPVWLGLKKIRIGINNAGHDTSKQDEAEKGGSTCMTRYYVSPSAAEIYDLFDEDNKADIKLLDHQLCILFGNQGLHAADYELFKIAELTRTGNHVVLSDKFIPPVISIHSSRLLVRKLRDLHECLLYSSRAISVHARDGQAVHTMQDSQQIKQQLLSGILNRYIFNIGHLLHDGDMSPYGMFCLLNQLIAEISPFINNPDPPGVDYRDGKQYRYEHDDIAAGLFPVINRVAELLNDITLKEDYIYLLEYNGEYYFTELHDDALNCKHCYLRIIFDADYYEEFNEEFNEELNSDFLASLQDNMKISSAKELPLLIRHALPGVDYVYEKIVPRGLPGRKGCLYFRLNRHNHHWDDISGDRNMAVSNDAVPRAASLELVFFNE